ncbi:hypothetical protein DPMN_139207 [Dreissena polymorpha]|uniref:Uncharacterized protein n=1 Tax=Dreissena polymorpha TaxID=45954 RepID=A0A9D4G846_DREPO|nr:hypothetical protein DPMN_139207 [Dreissena polymorpha]
MLDEQEFSAAAEKNAARAGILLVEQHLDTARAANTLLGQTNPCGIGRIAASTCNHCRTSVQSVKNQHAVRVEPACSPCRISVQSVKDQGAVRVESACSPYRTSVQSVENQRAVRVKPACSLCRISMQSV